MPLDVVMVNLFALLLIGAIVWYFRLFGRG